MHIRTMTRHAPAVAAQDMLGLIDMINGMLQSLAALLDTIAMISSTLGKQQA